MFNLKLSDSYNIRLGQFTLQLPSRELDINTVPADADNRPVIEDPCCDQE